MRFRDIAFSREKRFALGQDMTAGGFYLSIPVSNQTVDYEEYYAISKQELDGFLADETAAELFAGRCRRREMDHLLIVQYGSRRGSAV
jgi:hypothetical protein